MIPNQKLCGLSEQIGVFKDNDFVGNVTGGRGGQNVSPSPQAEAIIKIISINLL